MTDNYKKRKCVMLIQITQHLHAPLQDMSIHLKRLFAKTDNSGIVWQKYIYVIS